MVQLHDVVQFHRSRRPPVAVMVKGSSPGMAKAIPSWRMSSSAPHGAKVTSKVNSLPGCTLPVRKEKGERKEEKRLGDVNWVCCGVMEHAAVCLFQHFKTLVSRDGSE
jgi:hypothetical protein